MPDTGTYNVRRRSEKEEEGISVGRESACSDRQRTHLEGVSVGKESACVLTDEGHT